MSVVSTLGNFKNMKDYENKRSQFFKTLNLQAQLNKRYEDAMIQRSQIEKLGIQPLSQTPRGLEDEKRDDVGQQTIALRHLQSIMIPSQATKALQELDMVNVRLLNTYWGKFATQVRGIKNIDAEFFRRLFTNFLKYVEDTDEFARPIPLRESTMARLSGDLLDKWNAYARREIDPMTEQITDIKKLILETATATSRSAADVRQEVASEETLPMSPATPQPPRQPRPTASRTTLPFLGEEEEEGMTPTPLGSTRRSALPSRRSLQDVAMELEIPIDITKVAPTKEQAGRLFRAADTQGVSLSMKEIKALLQPLGKTTRSYEDGTRKLTEAYGAMTEMTSMAKKEEQGRGMYMGMGRGLSYGASPSQPISNYTPQLVYRGNGTIRLTGKNNRTIMERGLMTNKIGSGILMDDKQGKSVDYRQLGRYMLNMKHLKDGVMYVKYQSLERIPTMPPRVVSPDFQEIIYRLFETGKIDRTMFSQLSETEQDYLEFLVKRCHIFERVGMGKLRPPSNIRPCIDPDEQNDMETRRFQLLRGMIAAGNNDKSVLKELRSFLYKFMDEGRLTKKVGQDIIKTLSPAIKV